MKCLLAICISSTVESMELLLLESYQFLPFILGKGQIEHCHDCDNVTTLYPFKQIVL